MTQKKIKHVKYLRYFMCLIKLLFMVRFFIMGTIHDKGKQKKRFITPGYLNCILVPLEVDPVVLL